MPVHPELIELIRCPKCRGTLVLQEGGERLTCDACRVSYPVLDGIPQLLADEARPLEARG